MGHAAAQIGVIGGSFNPPHTGHLVIASEAVWRLGLRHVSFMPAADPPHKRIEDDVPAELRLEMTEAAVAADQRLRVSSLEIDRGLRYTVDALEALRQEFPLAEVWFIMGSDSLLAFHTWRRPERILQLCRLAVAPRQGDAHEAIEAAAARYGNVVVMDSAVVAISSSDIRQRVREGRTIRYLVPASVERIIERHGLYQRRTP